MSEDPKDSRYSTLWWAGDVAEGAVHERMVPYWRALQTKQKTRERMDLLHATLYADMPVRGLGPFAYMQWSAEPDSARLNLIKAVTDTWVSAMIKDTPRPMTLTNKGDWNLKRRGEGLNRWLEGIYDELEIPDEVCPFIYLNAAVFGTCWVKVFEDVPGGDWNEAKVGVDTAFSWEITADEAEAQNPRNVRSLFHAKWYDVDQLVEMFPGKKAEILDAPKRSDLGEAGYSPSASPNLVKVVEGWHLPSSRTAKDGARAICLPNATLARVPWERQAFPFAPFARQKAPMGLYGIGIAQELRGPQTSINEILMAYEEAIIFFARPKWMVPRGSNVTRAHLDDRIGTVLEFDGPVAPVMYVPNVVMPADVQDRLQDMWAKGFEQTGTNQMLAMGQVPAGLKSGEAIRRYNDTGTARQASPFRLRDHFHVRLANLLIESGRTIAEKNPKFASTYVGKKAREVVFFRKVDPGRDRFSLKVHPVNALSSTPAERLEQLDMLANHNPPLIDEHTYRLLLNWPDLDAENSLANAPYEVVDKILADIYDAYEDPEGEANDEEGKPKGTPLEVALDARHAPDPNWPLAYMRARVQFAAAQAFLDNAPDEVLDALNAYLDRIEAVVEQVAAEQAAKDKAAAQLGAPPPPAPPMGAPIQPGAPATIPAGAPLPAAA